MSSSSAAWAGVTVTLVTAMVAAKRVAKNALVIAVVLTSKHLDRAMNRGWGRRTELGNNGGWLSDNNGIWRSEILNNRREALKRWV